MHYLYYIPSPTTLGALAPGSYNSVIGTSHQQVRSANQRPIGTVKPFLWCDCKRPYCKILKRQK